MQTRASLIIVAVLPLCVLFPTEASAYVGPGAGLTVIGAALAFVASVILAFVGFIWYPIKRLLKARSKKVSAGK